MKIERLVLDTETSGLPPDAGVCEIAWLSLNKEGIWTHQVQSLIDPEREISPAASGAHGLVYEDVCDAPTLSQFFSADDPSCYGKRIQGDKVIFAAHRASFDLHFVEPYIDGELLVIDTLRWARHLYPGCENHQLSTLKYALNLRKDAGGAHRAMADVMVTYDLLHHIMQRLNVTVDALADLSRKPLLVAVVPFGKHKGQLYSEVPRSYLQWMQRELKDLDIDQAYTINYYLNN